MVQQRGAIPGTAAGGAESDKQKELLAALQKRLAKQKAAGKGR
jgi:hypothetical protein